MTEANRSTDAMTTTLSDREVVFTRILKAPRELVFKAWTDPRQMACWWGPHGFTNPVCELDVRPGGMYRIVMRSPDGVDYPVKGVYREVVAPGRLVFSMDTDDHPADWHDLLEQYRQTEEHGLNLLWTVTFEDYDGATKLTVRNRFASVADRDAALKMGHLEGASQLLERLAEIVANI